MKLDLNGIIPPQLKHSPTVASTAIADQSASNPAVASTPVDRTTFQSGPANVKTLVANALATPEIRQDKVDSIKQSISNGTYKFDAGKVADAMIASSKQS